MLAQPWFARVPLSRLLLCCGITLTQTTQAEDQTFYTILTPDGPMQVQMPVPSSRVQFATPAPAVSPPALSQSAGPKVAQSPPVPVAPEPVAAQPPAPAVASPFTEFAGQQYVDTAYLEQREFNLEGRKRFYSVPDGLGGTQVVERESGVALSRILPQLEQPPVVTLAVGYRRVAAATLSDLTNRQCLSSLQLKTAKPLNDQPLDLWPRPGFKPTFEFVLAKLATEVRDIHVMSYSMTSRRPSYYWPLPIFLDERGCILEGVAGFYQSKTPATWLQQSALQGHLHVPQDAHYLLLTPLVEAAELSRETLADRGQLRLTPLRSTAP